MTTHPRRTATPPPSLIPELSLLPTPQPAPALPTGLLVAPHGSHTPNTLSDRDYDDAGVRWYKDVILFDAETGTFASSLGAAYTIKAPAAGLEAGTIEAPETRVRMLKDAEASLRRALADPAANTFLRENVGGGEVGFVTATREVLNASYKRARLVDVGNGDFEVVREVGGDGGEEGAKRRDSGLVVETGCKRDVVGVVVRRVVVDGDQVRLGEEMGARFWS